MDEQKAQTEQTLKTKENELKTSIPQVRWYVQDRQSLGGFSALKSDLDSIQSLGNAFPIVFLVVAVMMSLTSMARMVEEDRSLIGTYVGLGYGRLAVASRYLLFALLACLIGGGLGLLVGFLGIPAFLLVVLEGMYVMPGVRLEYDWLYGSLGIALFVVGVLAATIYACVQEMRMTSAALMRPKAPRAGSRILLERIKPVWNRMGFLSKVTARNIFRFKSRLIMTVGGVAGCTALIVCGLAINDTVADLGIKQYRDVYQYDLMVVSGDSDADEMRAKVASDGRTTSTMNVRIESGDMAVGKSDSGSGDSSGSVGSESIQLVTVPEKRLSDLGKMVTLQPVHSGILGTSSIGGKGSLKLDDDGVIVAQSAASSLGIATGSKVRLTNGDGVQATAKVSAVNRNLIGSDVYISETYYVKLFGKSFVSNVSVSGESDAQGAKTGVQLSVSPESDTLTVRNPSAVTSAVCSLPDACTCPRMPGSTTTCAVRGAASISAVRLLSAFDCANSSIASPDEIISTTAQAAQYSCTATVDAIATTASRSTPTWPCRRSSIMPRTVTTIVYATSAITIHCPTPGLNALSQPKPACKS